MVRLKREKILQQKLQVTCIWRIQKIFFFVVVKKLLYNVLGFLVNVKCQGGIIINCIYVNITSFLNWINLALQRQIILIVFIEVVSVLSNKPEVQYFQISSQFQERRLQYQKYLKLPPNRDYPIIKSPVFGDFMLLYNCNVSRHLKFQLNAKFVMIATMSDKPGIEKRIYLKPQMPTLSY